MQSFMRPKPSQQCAEPPPTLLRLLTLSGHEASLFILVRAGDRFPPSPPLLQGIDDDLGPRIDAPPERRADVRRRQEFGLGGSIDRRDEEGQKFALALRQVDR